MPSILMSSRGCYPFKLERSFWPWVLRCTIASGLEELGYGRYPNVVDAMQYERLASRSGPTEGIVTRPSDQKAAAIYGLAAMYRLARPG